MLQAAERADDVMKRTKLSLILMRRFPPLTAKYGERLLEALLAAETADQGKGRRRNEWRILKLFAGVINVETF